jgi:acetyl-CoA carboxylase carboxyltransferase component
MVMVAQKTGINNSTFEDEQEIGKAVSDWTSYYNKKHRFKASIKFTGRKHQCVYMT